ncbi:MAG: DUF6443 domain-containing protein [Bacteroidales bacterium]|nr:DUF6443 domain-containing protein [Bacteroidales bacterium]
MNATYINIARTFFAIFFLSTMFPVELTAQPDNVTCNDLYNGQAEIMARTSVTLQPGFVGVAGCNVKAWINPALSMPSLVYSPVGGNQVVNITPDSDQNYILTTTLRAATTNPDNILSTPNMQSVEYFDGLGRLIQKVIPRGSPLKKDVVSAIQYDNMGRVDKEYLPFISTDNNGTFKDDAYNKCVAYYSQPAGSIVGRQPDNTPFATMHYDNSPLNRSTGVTPSGQDWAAHPTAIAYKTNSAAVQHWRVNSDGSFSSFSFEANTLYVNENADEDGHITRTYTDKLGQVVLKEAVDENGVAHKTSYIYDDFGLLRCVVPPKNHQSGPTAELSYYYNYDSRKRMIEKRLPGTEWIYYVYDKRDRLAMWQDGVNRAVGKWHYHLYDALNRPVVSGLMSCSITAATLRTDFAAFNGTLYESFAVGNLLFGYTNTSFPVGCRPTSGSVHATTYYDNYNFKQVFTGNYDFPSVPAGGNISNQYLTSGKGMVTGALEMSDLFTNMLTVNYYDNRWQLICSVSDNHLGGRNNHFFRYHFDGQVAERIVTHSSHYQPLTTLRYNYTYDHAGRVLVEHLSVDNQPAITLQAHEYNEPGELTGTYLHNSKPAIQGSPFNQKIRKEYNTRGWLTRINNPEHPAYNLFSLSLQYQNPVATGNMGTPSCFNGNIAQTLWNDPIAGNQGYAYCYDGLNRLKGANYGAGNQYEGNTGHYDTYYSYDHNGNMSQLKRKRAGVQIDDLLYSYMNNGNRLESVVDGATTDGYVPNTGTYTYDQNGNTTYDPSRGINIQYNHLNLPTRVEFGPDDMVFYYYSTTGTKQGKQVRTWHTAASYTTQYSGSFTYTNNTLSSIATPAGRLVPVLHNGQVHWKTEYNLTDHLGNVRVVFAAHANGQPEVMQQTSYYPFGYTLQQNDFSAGVTSENKNLYNGKELQNDVLAGSRLDWYDYGARFYDPVVGRFTTLDRFSEKFYESSPYQYAAGNPVKYIDLNGDSIVISIHSSVINADGSSTIKSEDYYYGMDSDGKYGFIGSDGKQYSGDNSFVKQVASALNDLKSGGSVGESLVSDIGNSANKVEIVHGQNAAGVDGSFIRFDPSNTKEYPNQTGSTSRPPFIALGHEMAHTWDVWNGTYDASEWVSGTGINRSEIYATHIENMIRAENKLPLRTHYAIMSGKPYEPTRIIDSKSGASLYYTQYKCVNLNTKQILGSQPPRPIIRIESETAYKY